MRMRMLATMMLRPAVDATTEPVFVHFLLTPELGNPSYDDDDDDDDQYSSSW